MINLEAENTYLGCILKSGELIKESVLQEKHFYDPSNKKIFKTMRQLEEGNEPIDIVSVVLTSKGEVDKGRLANLVNSVATLETFKTIEKHIIESWKLREAKRIQKIEIGNLSDINKIQEKLSGLEAEDTDDEYSHKEMLVELYQNIEQQKKGLSGYDTGFKDLNKYLDGFQEGDLIISAARPSVGKTAKMINHAIRHCQNGGITIIFSLEMSAESLNRRMLSTIGKIDGHKMRNPKQYFNDSDWTKFTKALGVLEKMNLYIYDKSGQTASYIRSKVRKLRKEYPEKEMLVQIDYLQLMRTDGKYERKDLEVGAITRAMKEMARDEKVPVFLLSQLSRGVTQREDKRPMMSDIRDSGSVEQDADVIEFLHREDYYDAETDKKNIVEVIIAKQRNGPVGTVEMAYIKEYNLFLDLERRYDN